MGKNISRRSFLKLATMTGVSAAADACKPEGVKLIPYLVPEQNVIPGVPAFFRTICGECASGCGVVARVREGRIIKLEGNPDNPINAGALCARGQAALQGLYNPDRLPRPFKNLGNGAREKISWSNTIAVIADRCKQAAHTGADRIAFVGRPRGPSFDRVVRGFLASFNSGRLHYYEPINESAEREAAQSCFGIDSLPEYRIDRARTLISFGADFLETWKSPVELSRQYGQFRAPKPRADGDNIGLAFYVGPRMSLTAAKTDYYIPCRPGTESLVAWSIIHVMAEKGHLSDAANLSAVQAFASAYSPHTVASIAGVDEAAITKMAAAFGRAPAAVALAGTNDSDAHRAAFILNWITGNVGKTQFFPANSANGLDASGQGDLVSLVEALQNRAIDVLIIADSNPVFTLSPTMRLVSALAQVPVIVWCGGVLDETAARAHFLLPIHHPLEEWGDSAPRPGVFLLGQPAMQPVFESRPLGDILIQVISATGAKPKWPNMHAAVMDSWSEIHESADGPRGFDEFWTKVRRDGGLFTSSRELSVRFNASALAHPPKPPSPGKLTFITYPQIFLYDGRGADKPWLQENPEPIHQIVWDSWVEIHPHAAKRLNVENNQIVRLTSEFGAIELPAKVSKGTHPDVIAAPLGQGHTAYGRYARDRGANPWELLPPDSLRVEITVEKTADSRTLVSPLFMDKMLGRPIVEAIELGEFDKGKRPPPKEPTPPGPYELRSPPEYAVHNWGMTIDVNSCTGCGACVTACYAENNLNVVGKRNVQMGRIMSWVRIERYFPDTDDAPQIYTMPMLCQQCDQAPCEPVCPVYASYHTQDGLNGQIYNRCIGTRYCENNCPYKVRRFNWFKPEFAEPLNLQLNPDVTVRGEGVMEKCTFCVQRIRASEITAKLQDRRVRDGEITPACAQTCPTRAIIFGDIKDLDSAMMRTRYENKVRTYRALEDLNTQPSIVYLRTIYRKQPI
jgi:anaerobic selenocysteine-containing dehydrogenase/Fe-S-cluster-containing dehydrogenase component